MKHLLKQIIHEIKGIIWLLEKNIFFILIHFRKNEPLQQRKQVTFPLDKHSPNHIKSDDHHQGNIYFSQHFIQQRLNKYFSRVTQSFIFTLNAKKMYFIIETSSNYVYMFPCFTPNLILYPTYNILIIPLLLRTKYFPRVSASRIWNTNNPIWIHQRHFTYLI